MGDKIDMSLDDIIKMDGISGKKRGQKVARRSGNSEAGTSAGERNTSGRQNRGGAIRNKMNRNNKSTPYSRGSRIPDKWQHDKFETPARSQGSNHLLVSNLDYGVSCKDIQDLFVEFGPLKKAAVHYERSGRSLGTADVIFMKSSDAAAAMKQYNGVLLDGRPMKITLVQSGDQQRRQTPTSGQGNFKFQKFGNSSRGGAGFGTRSRGRGGGSTGMSNRGPKRVKNLTAEELDAELDAYVNK